MQDGVNASLINPLTDFVWTWKHRKCFSSEMKHFWAQLLTSWQRHSRHFFIEYDEQDATKAWCCPLLFVYTDPFRPTRRWCSVCFFVLHQWSGWLKVCTEKTDYLAMLKLQRHHFRMSDSFIHYYYYPTEGNQLRQSLAKPPQTVRGSDDLPSGRKWLCSQRKHGHTATPQDINWDQLVNWKMFHFLKGEEGNEGGGRTATKTLMSRYILGAGIEVAGSYL